jgi:hypothetical protein
VEITRRKQDGHVAWYFTCRDDLRICPNSISMRHIMGRITNADRNQMGAYPVM